MSIKPLTPTSYLVLGLLSREGPSTPYQLKRHVGATLGNFWKFPHTLLYTEPPRLVQLGLATEEREDVGRRRRVFTITSAGLEALQAWLAQPSSELTELRDLGLLQLFFADLTDPSARLRIALQQLEIHRARLVEYEEAARYERNEDQQSSEPHARSRTAEHWRGETLRMGLLYERAAVGFWSDVTGSAGLPDATPARAPAEDDGVRANESASIVNQGT